MVREFRIDKTLARLVDKTTFLKVLNFLDAVDISTPCLLIDAEKVRKNVSLIGSKIDNCNVFYAVKANPDINILKIVNKSDVGFEVASEGELRILSDIGVKPEKIISSNPVKTLTFLKEASLYGIRYFSFDSFTEIEKLAEYVPGSNAYVRLSVPNEGSEWPLSRKFGVEIDDALKLLIAAKKKGLNPAGITFHVGSQCTNLYNWNIAIDKAKLLWNMAKSANLGLSLLNLGGGYPIKYTKSVLNIENIERHINSLIIERFPAGIEIHLEPGRAVIGDAGIFVCSVIGKTRRSGENWLYIDAGVFNGLMESVGGIRYSYIAETHNGSGAKKNWTIAGPSCDSFDIIDKNVALPEPEIGDLILILSGGAYTVSYASEFNGFAIPEIVVL